MVSRVSLQGLYGRISLQGLHGGPNISGVQISSDSTRDDLYQIRSAEFPLI